MSSASSLLGFLFLSPIAALATAGAAVSVPIIIHLLNRRRYRIVNWAAMRFLLAAQKQSVRKMRLEQFLLLAVRCAVLLLLVLAMASVMPWAEAFWYRLFPDQAVLAAVGRQRTHKILVLDGSFSMALKPAEESFFDRARDRAVQILDSSPGGDGFSVVLMAAPPQNVVPEPSDDPRKVAEEIRKLRLPHGNADLLATLNAVDGLLRSSPEKFEAREVYFLTDLQRASWGVHATADLGEAMQRVQGKARIVLVDVGHDGVSNLAVSNLTLGSALVTSGMETPVTATIHHYGVAEARAVRVELLIGKARTTGAEPPFEPRVVAQEIVRVPSGRTGVAVTFKHKFTAPGDYVVQVRLENDALQVDNTRSLVVTVKDTVPVMLVNGKPAAEPLDQATQFLRVALNPYDKGPVPRNVPARPRVVSESQFADATLGDLTPYDCVFLCDVARLGGAEVRRLETHLRRGGGVVFSLGPRVDLEAYNRLVYANGQGILPGRLLGVQRAAEDRVFTFYAEEDAYRQSPLGAFAADVDRAGLLGARFRRYVRTELPGKGRAHKILSFMPEPEKEAKDRTALPVGDPALVEWPRYRGRVILLTTTVNMDWASWPASPSYPVMMQELLRFAVAGRLHEQAVPVGTPLEEFLPAGNVGIDFQVLTPDGRTVEGATQPLDDTARMMFGETDQSGIYRVTLGLNPREYLYAVNVPAATDSHQMAESDPERIKDLQQTYPSWQFQVVADPKDVIRDLAAGGGLQIVHGMGTQIARVLLLIVLGLVLLEVVLAWRLGHYSKSGVPAELPVSARRTLPIAAACVFGLFFLVVAGVLAHAIWTQDFLSFLPDRFRGGAERALDVPQPVAGESTRWRLEYSSYLLRNAVLEPWAVGTVAVLSLVMVLAVYHREGRTASRPYRLLLAGLRVFFLLLLLAVLLPQLQVRFERQSWPDVAILIDDSLSMSAADQYRDPAVKEAAEQLAQTAKLTKPERLALAQALLTHEKYDWLSQLLAQRQVKVHVYRCSNQLERIAELTKPENRADAVQMVLNLQAKREHDASRLGYAVREVVKRYRGSSLAAVVMLTDGVTTEGEDLIQASRYAAQMGVPLTFIGLGDAHEVRDLILHDLQVEETVFVNDRLVFEARLTAQGYTHLPAVTVTLSEKQKDGSLKRLTTEKVAIDPQGKPVKFRLTHQPAEPGEKVYVLEVPVQPDEVKPAENNRLERTVFVREAKPSRVLYIEGYARPEFRFVKTLLERESVNEHGNKSIDLKVLLLDAQEDWHLQDKSARPDFPTKEELSQFDVVILGDVDPKHPKIGEKNISLLVDFVRERGGGLLLIAGKRDNPRSYKDTPLADVMPIQMVDAPVPEDPDAAQRDGFRPQLTPLGRLHPIFRFSPDEAENAAIWNRLAEIFWYAEGYRLQPAAEVLAVHPKVKAIEPARPGAGGDERHPLIVQHFVGAGRCLFLGIEETWAWGFRDDLLRFNQFWVQTVHYLARSRLGRIDLRLDRQTSYRRGEPIRMTVRFPDDSPPPAVASPVKVLVEHRAPNSGETEVQTLQLAKLEGSRATYEGLLTRTPEGDYRFSLNSPVVNPPKPRAECRVLPPPGELERLRMNQSDMERAAELTHGRFYDLAGAERFLDEMPSGNRISLSTSGPPWRLWNHFATFGLALGLLGTEWILRKRKHLL